MSGTSDITNWQTDPCTGALGHVPSIAGFVLVHRECSIPLSEVGASRVAAATMIHAHSSG